MPQMSPLLWATMFILFTTALIAFNSIMFFHKKDTPNKMTKQDMKMNTLEWKW